MSTLLNVRAEVFWRLLCGDDAIVLWCCVRLLFLLLAALVIALSSVFAFFFPFRSISLSSLLPGCIDVRPSVSMYIVSSSLISSPAFRSLCWFATPPFPALTLLPLIPYTRKLMYLYALLLSFPHRCDFATLYGTL